jgi:hypothetical protein
VFHKSRSRSLELERISVPCVVIGHCFPLLRAVPNKVCGLLTASPRICLLLDRLLCLIFGTCLFAISFVSVSTFMKSEDVKSKFQVNLFLYISA